ncbi:MAG: P-loop NTPase fold protein [Polyangiaceae bacterium]
MRALAAVLASTQVEPPLSVGLFGDWGSGKSFFMGKLRQRIAELAAAADKQKKKVAKSYFCGGEGAVVQIEFNAWHYMDADLWSSLAVRVFDALAKELKESFAKGCLANLESVKERAAELEAAKTELEVKTGTLQLELTAEQELRATRKLAFQEYARGLATQVAEEVSQNDKVQAAAEQLGVQAGVTRESLRVARADFESVVGTVLRLCLMLRSPRRLLVFMLVLGVAAAIGWLTSHAYDLTGRIATTSVLSLVSLVAMALRSAKTATGALDTALDKVELIEAEARAKKGIRERAVEAEVEQIAARVAEIERERIQLEKRKAELEAQLAALRGGSTRTLMEFILERTTSGGYRKNLGVISAIHEDFKELAGFLKPNGVKPNVERIILYIDDLDRCPPQRVVEVLQAIHLILSLPLFVVVVGVDSRWLLDSLAAYQRQQFPSDAVAVDATRPQQYLEKIFQIPFTLTPMSSDGYQALVGALLGPHVDAAPDDVRSDDDAGARQQSGHAELGHSEATPARRATAIERPEEQRPDLAPRGLRLEPRELTYMKGLSDLIGSPRSAKRFVNLYRIVRATLDDVELDRLIEGGYKPTQIWLALVIGNPKLGAEIFEQVLSRKLSSAADLGVWCQERQARGGRSQRDIATLLAVAQRIVEFDDWKATFEAVLRVARFSFETGRVLGHFVNAREAAIESQGSERDLAAQ